jgi:L-aspartate oxidase
MPMLLREKQRREDFERRNIHTVAGLIAMSALAREESRGGHYRDDFPGKRQEFEKHSSLTKGSAIRFVAMP